MATATDLFPGLGITEFIPFEITEGLTAVVVGAPTEMTAVSQPMDTLGSGATQIVSDPTEYVNISVQTDSLGATVNQDSGGTSQEGVDVAPLIYKMRGYSTTLGQYVYWRSVGDTFVPPPSEYGTVINITSELIA